MPATASTSGPPRSTGGTRPMAGPGVAERVEAAAQAIGVKRPATIGWAAGEVPLRPALGAARPPISGSIRWAIVEPADDDRVNDPGPVALADWADAMWGPGLCYLAGIGWGAERGPLLDRAAIGRLLDAARVRIWWRDGGPLDALRVVECVEHGCTPIQVMPAEAAAEARRALPAELAALVTTMDDAGDLDALVRATRRAEPRLGAGSLERELDLHVAFGSTAAEADG